MSGRQMGQCRGSQRIPNRPLHSFLVQNSINREYVQEMGCIDSISNATCHNAGLCPPLDRRRACACIVCWGGQTFFGLLNPDRKSAKSRHGKPALGRIDLPTEEKAQKEQKLPTISIAITVKTMPESEMPGKSTRRQRANEGSRSDQSGVL